ncbi:hypothetical protein ACFYOK_29390 [Microbispora bryophytorum]|uniref:hypothetical protein n=1 Tax=Microbispora bryophytorum TaxID=1460882 RepID=UPI0033F3D1BD
MVRMRHPALPKDQVVEALPSQVQPYQRSGWEVIEDEPPTEEAPPEPGGDSPPKTADQTSEAPATAGASALSGQPQRRARTTTAKGDDE